MTTISLSPSTQRITIKPKLLVREEIIPPNFQSLERRKLAEVTDEIWRTLTLSEQQLTTPEDVQEISYNPIPPKRTFTVRAKYQFKGRIEPQPYQLDDE
jgi:hypothetical protein